MKCPLRMIARPGLMLSEAHPNDGCLQEKCAWWNNTNDECAVLQLSKSIYYMGVELAQMEIKMPHLEQFKRA